MSGEYNRGYIPKHLDNPPKFGLWDIYQSMIFLMFFGAGVVFHQLFTGALIGGSLAWWYGKTSSGQSKGVLVHILYWYTPFARGYKSIPDSYKRFFRG